MMSAPSVYVEANVEGHVARLVLANPPLHTINAAGSEQLLNELERLGADPEIRVLIITGASDDIFVRHYEVAELASSSHRLTQRSTPAQPVKSATTDVAKSRPRGLRGAMLALESMDAVTIAAINGMAMGGGLELALACDFRLARAGDFRIGLPETGVGILPGGGGTQRLARLLGVAQALDLILHGTLMNPQTALELGIVNRVFENDLSQYRRQVDEFASNLATRAPRALANAKHAIRRGIELSVDEGLRLEAKLFGELMATDDAATALAAARDGQPRPEFHGR